MRVASLLDDSVLQRPGLVPGDLEIQVGVVDAPAHQRDQRAIEVRFVEARRRQQRLPGGVYQVDRLGR